MSNEDCQNKDIEYKNEFDYLFSIGFSDMSISSIIQQVAQRLLPPVSENSIRLRLKASNSAVRKVILDSDGSLSASIGQPFDGLEICIQHLYETRGIAQHIEHGSIVFWIRRWKPREAILDEAIEMSIAPSITVPEFLSMISDIASIPKASIAIAKPRSYQLKREGIKYIPGLTWMDGELTEDDSSHRYVNVVVSQPPISLDHGDTILIKDSTEVDILPIIEETGPIQREEALVIRTKFSQ